ncbi:MAG: hypothetical protein AB3N06_00985 [Erythrobacter sp.]
MTRAWIRAIPPAVATAGLAIAMPASSQDRDAATDQPETQESTERADRSDALICRTEKVIGSRAKRRKTCLTRAQWERVARKGNAFSRGLVAGAATGMWEGTPDN